MNSAKKKLPFLSIYALKFKSCLNFRKININNLEHWNDELPNYAFFVLFSKENNDVNSLSYFEDFVVKNDEKGKILRGF